MSYICICATFCPLLANIVDTVTIFSRLFIDL